MFVRTSLAIPLAVAAVVCNAPNATSQPPVTAAASKSCDLQFPMRRPTVLAPTIFGDATATCDITPERHVVTFSLDREHGGVWVKQTYVVNSEIPSPATRYYTSAECAIGRRHVR